MVEASAEPLRQVKRARELADFTHKKLAPLPLRGMGWAPVRTRLPVPCSWLVNGNKVVRGGNTVHYDLHVVAAGRDAGRNVYVGVGRSLVAHGHGAVIMGTGIVDQSRAGADEADKRIVRGVLGVVTVGAVLGNAVEPGSLTVYV